MRCAREHARLVAINLREVTCLDGTRALVCQGSCALRWQAPPWHKCSTTTSAA
ncbi:hypothetical protein OJ998_10435 [Solirubrobacter taibaiensis]|nr:hypothetical protein [Solirubrobacter taibaiensis]